jgi:hypothetical protein
MQTCVHRELLSAPAAKRWSRSRALGICPRRHLRVLPIRTRPSLFGGDYSKIRVGVRRVDAAKCRFP